MPDPESPAATCGVGEFRAICAAAIPEVYRFMFHRCGDPDLADDLMAEALLAAARRYRDGEAGTVTVAWIMSVARNKLLEHWRRSEREQYRLRLMWASQDEPPLVPPPDEASPERVLSVLRQMSPLHQAVLTLRYLDGLGVPDVARELGRSLHATESLLSRAKAAFRRAYAELSDE